MSKVYNILTDNILKMIASGVAPWRRPWDASRGRSQAPMNIRGTRYRGINYLILSNIAAMNGWSNVWMTFNQVKEKGGTIREGEKGSPAYFFKVLEKHDSNGDLETSFPIFRYFLVFNLSQVDGIIVKGVNDGSETPAIQLAAPQSIVEGYKGCPVIRHNDNRAYYTPVTDIVTMPEQNTFDTVEHYYATLFHELAHSTGHRSRLNRKEVMGVDYFGSHNYSLEELVAELTSVFLCNECGIDNDPVMENAASYLAGWHKALSNDPKMFAIAASRAQKAADHILGKKEEENPEE